MDGISGPLRARTNPGREPAEYAEIQDAVRFGDWVAAQHGRDEPGSRERAWSIYNLAHDGWMGWRACREVAVEAARLLAEKVPILEPYPSAGTAAERTAERTAYRERFGALWQPIMHAALAKRAPKPARPFTVEVKRSVQVLVFAESWDEAYGAVQDIDRDDLDTLLVSRAYLETGDPVERDAADACNVAGISFDPKGYHNDSERYFWVVGGHIFRPDVAPAHLYIVAENRDHGWACAARKRESGRPAPNPGPCNCNARVFPARPTEPEVL